MILRQETPTDYHVVHELVQKAFASEIHSDHREHLLVENLRKSEHFIPELSIVATIDNLVVGYILLSKIKIVNPKQTFNSLALAPVAVLPEYQKNGIGRALINYAHEKAKQLNYSSIILLGHKDYYPKFGYKLASTFGIKLQFDVPEENCMAIELCQYALKGISGIVEYPKEFYS